MSKDASFFLVLGIVFLAAGIFSGYALYFAYPNVITDMMSDAQPPIAGLFAPLLPVIFFAVGLIMMYYFFRPPKQRGFPPQQVRTQGTYTPSIIRRVQRNRRLEPKRRLYVPSVS